MTNHRRRDHRHYRVYDHRHYRYMPRSDVILARAQPLLFRAGAKQPADARVQEVRGKRLQQHRVTSSLQQFRNALNICRDHEHGRRFERFLCYADDVGSLSHAVHVGDHERRCSLDEILPGDVAVRRRDHPVGLPKHGGVLCRARLSLDEQDFVMNRGGGSRRQPFERIQRRGRGRSECASHQRPLGDK